jgi:long-chain fatty acid transport protein
MNNCDKKEWHVKRNLGTSIIATAIAGLFSIGVNGAYGAGFALIEQSASGMGNAYAGAAAVAEDASTIYFNPAGMNLLGGSQFVVVGHLVNLSAEFTGTATKPFLEAPVGPGAATGGNGGDLGSSAFVPNLYFAMPVGERMYLGLGINAPFGLVTEYDANWVGRYQGVKSEITSININPAISYQVSDTISIGGGINYQQLDAELTNAVILGLGASGDTRLEADDDGWGWNIGAMFQLSPATRLGISYRSEIDYELEGGVSTTSSGVPVAAASGPARADATVPDMFSLSLAHTASDRLELLADVTRTGWSSINQINVVNTTNGAYWDVLVLDFDDAWRYSIGTNYVLNDKWTLKAGLAFDETPVKNAASRTVRIPDNDRTWISFGGKVKINQTSWFDLGYSHIFIKDAQIDHTKTPQPPAGAAGATTVTGNYEGDVDIFSVQYTYSF